MTLAVLDLLSELGLKAEPTRGRGRGSGKAFAAARDMLQTIAARVESDDVIDEDADEHRDLATVRARLAQLFPPAPRVTFQDV